MTNPYYNHTDGVPVYLARGTSSAIEAEYDLIGAGFDGVNTAIVAAAATSVASLALKGNITNQVWLGTHAFPATTSGVTAAFGSSGTAYATLDFVNAVATSAVLPGQGGNAGKFLQTNGTVASWADPFPTQTLGWLRSTGSALSFTQTHTGYAQNEVKGADIASAGTINLTTATGNLLHLTGTTNVTAITIPVGARRTMISDGVLTLTHSASLLCPGGANITTAANDRWDVVGDTAGATIVNYTRADGAPPKPGMMLLATLTPTAAANVDFLTTCTSAFDNYQIFFQALIPSADDQFAMRVANAGVVDTAANYGTGTNMTMGLTVESTGSKGISGSLIFSNTNDATGLKGSNGAVSYLRDTAAYEGQQFNLSYKGIAVSGFRFYWAAGSNFVASGKIRIYGYNNS